VTRRKQLLLTTVFVVALGGAFATVPFIGSLAPGPTAGKSLARIDIRHLAPGSFAVVDDRLEQAPYGTRFFVLKDFDGSLRVFAVPLKDGRTALPDVRWWRVAAWCDNFAPDSLDGRLTKSAVFSCKKAEPHWSEQNAREWRWDLHGKNLGKFTDDMPRGRYILQGNEVVFVGS
jgi:hypothetical protein